MDKIEKVKAEIERLYNQSLADENRQAELGLKSAACTSYGKSKVCKELLSFIDTLQEEPVSEKFEKLKKLADAMYYAAQQLTTDASRLHKAMDEYHKFIINEYHKEEPVSENKEKITYQGKEYIRCYHDELDEFANKYPKTVPPPEKKYAKYSDVDMVIAVKAGANWKEQQMMAKAVDATVHIDAGGYPYIPQMELYDYDKDIPLAKEGDKYKVILIKEE